MKTPEEIKKGLEHCINCEDCTGCIYYDECITALDCNPMHKDLQSYIERLEERIDLMLIQMRGDCGTCKHRSEDNGPCNACVLDGDRPAWEYEGLPEIGR